MLTAHGPDASRDVARPDSRPELDVLFDALADVQRLRLMDTLAPFAGTAAKLASKLDWTRDKTAKQLKLLERAGLVESDRIGRRVFYARSSGTLLAAMTWAADLWGQLPSVGLEDAADLDHRQLPGLAGALRAESRRSILERAARGGPFTQTTAARECGVSKGLASRGLAQLTEVDLVVRDATKLAHQHAASPAAIAALVRWLHTAVEIATREEAQHRQYLDARDAHAAEPRERSQEAARLGSAAESEELASVMSGAGARRSEMRERRVHRAQERLLDAVFAAFADDEASQLASAICDGAVTSADLAEKLGWTRDKVSRRLSQLAKAEVVEKRQDGPRVRPTPVLFGLVSARAWIGRLRTAPAPGHVPEVLTSAKRRQCSQALADVGRRNLLTQIGETPQATQAQLRLTCGLSQPVASRGLARLVEAGLVELRRAGGRAHYVLQAKTVESLWTWSQEAKLKLAAGRTTLAGDVAVLLALILVKRVSPRRWLLVAIGFQIIAVLVHVPRIIDPGIHRWAYAAAITYSGHAVVSAPVTGAVLHLLKGRIVSDARQSRS